MLLVRRHMTRRDQHQGSRSLPRPRPAHPIRLQHQVLLEIRQSVALHDWRHQLLAERYPVPSVVERCKDASCQLQFQSIAGKFKQHAALGRATGTFRSSRHCATSAGTVDITVNKLRRLKLGQHVGYGRVVQHQLVGELGGVGGQKVGPMQGAEVRGDATADEVYGSNFGCILPLPSPIAG